MVMSRGSASIFMAFLGCRSSFLRSVGVRGTGADEFTLNSLQLLQVSCATATCALTYLGQLTGRVHKFRVTTPSSQTKLSEET